MNKPLLLAFPVLLALTGCMSSDPAPLSVESSILLQSSSSWDRTPYRTYPDGQPELTLQKLHIPAGTALEWHNHQVPSAAYVLSGELVIETLDGRNRIGLKPGDTLAEVVGTAHRGVAGRQPVQLLVFYANAAGQPLSYLVTDGSQPPGIP